MKPRRRSDLPRLLRFMQPFAGQVALSVGLGSATVLASVGLLSASAYLIDMAALHPSIAVLEVAIVGVRFFGIARALLRYLERLSSHSINLRLLAKLRGWFYQAIEPLAPTRLKDYRGGDLLARGIADIETLEAFYVRAVAPPLSALVVTATASLFLGSFDLSLALALLVALVITGVGLPVLAHGLGQAPGREMVASRAALSAGLVETAQGLSDLLLYGQAQGFIERAIEEGRRYSQAQYRLSRVGALSNALATLVSGLALGGILMAGAPLVGSKLDGVMLGVVCLAALASFEAVTPLANAGQALAASLAVARRLFEIADTPAPVTSTTSADPLPQPGGAMRGSLSIRGLTLRYANDLPPALEGFDLELLPGKRVALVGESGAGKTSLVNALLRLCAYEAGEIALEGRELRCLDAEQARKRFAVVPQATHLFAGTLRQNLLLAAPGATDDELHEAVCLAGLEDWAAALPEGLDTWLGERGAKASGGEKQRVALARAWLQLRTTAEARILLLDEPTAHLDSLSEQRILRQIEQAAATLDPPPGLILITHRLAGVEQMDEIVALAGGKVIERGTHAELARRGGWYARMLQLQADLILP